MITLTTDFGSSDTYAGQTRGAILSVCPEAILVDLTHDVPPGDVEAGAFAIATAFATFPAGTIHVVVVDPGVGTERRGVIVRTESHTFVAPDNGVLARVLEREPARGAWVLEAAHYRRPVVSATFHGRDVFAPAAGWLARGIEPSNFGPPAGALRGLDVPRPRLEAGRECAVRVAHVDRFGNVVLDVSRDELAPWCDPETGLFRGGARAAGAEIRDVRRTYGDAPAGAVFLLFDSFDRLEIAVRDGSAAGRLGLTRGSDVALVL